MIKVVAAIMLFCGSLHAESERLLLITACSRSGTGYISKVLQDSGLDLGHELFRSQGCVSWQMVVDSQTAPWGDPRRGAKFTHIFHQVRHPLKVISSVCACEPKRSFDFIMQYLPEIHENDSKLVKAAKFWYYWNLIADQEAEWTYRVEEIGDVWEEFQQRLGVSLGPLPNVPDNTNHRSNYTESTWEDLKKQLDPDLYQNIRDLAQSYGYSLTN